MGFMGIVSTTCFGMGLRLLGSRDEFGRQAGLLLSTWANFEWETIIPPPCVQPWLWFISPLKTKNGFGNGIDVEVGRLLPLFNSSIWDTLPNIMKKVVTVLCGFDGHWTKTSTEGAYHFQKILWEAFMATWKIEVEKLQTFILKRTTYIFVKFRIGK